MSRNVLFVCLLTCGTVAAPGHRFKASVEEDGKFTLANERNGFSKSYTAR